MHVTHRHLAPASPGPFSYLNDLYGFRWLQMKGLLASLLLHFSVLRGALSASLITETSRCSRHQLPDSQGSKETSARAGNRKAASDFRAHLMLLLWLFSDSLSVLSCSLKLPLLLVKWRQKHSLSLRLMGSWIFTSPWCKISKQGAGGIHQLFSFLQNTFLYFDNSHLFKTPLRSQGAFTVNISS